MSWDSPLLEREHETQVLQGSLARVVSSGSGRLLLIEGDAGLGKTRLLRHLRECADGSGYAVLSARGARQERAFGFGIVRQLLERSAVGVDRSASVSAAALRVLDPAVTVEPDDGGEGPTELASLHGLYWFLADLCRQPTVLLVDDVHLADPESLRFIDHLRGQLDDLPVLVAVTARTDGPDVPSAVAEWSQDTDTIVVRPRPLGLLATARLLTGLLGGPVDPVFAEASRQSTDGNPLLLTTLADGLARERIEPRSAATGRIPAVASHAVSDHVGRLLEELPDDVRRVAEAVALLGDGAGVGLVADVLDVPADVVVDRASDLNGCGLLDLLAGPDPALSFRHPAFADAAASMMADEPRRELALRSADVLEARGAPAEQVAAQALPLPPGEVPRAAARLLRAADDAERRGALESAVGYLDRCLREDLAPEQRLHVLTTAGTISLETDLDQGVSFLERAVETAKGGDDPELWALLGAAYGSLRHPDAAVDAMEQAVRLLPSDDDDRRRHWEASLLVGAAVAPGRHDLAQRIEELRRLPPADGIGARLLDGILGFHEMTACEPHGAERAHRAVADGTLVEHANGEGPLVCAWITLAAADDPLALRSLDDAVRHAQERGSLRALTAALSFRAMALLRAGRPLDAADDARVALGHSLDGQVDLDPRFPGVYLADALLEAGELDRAEETLQSVRALAPEDAGPRYYARDAVARLRRLQGRHAEALRIAEDAGAVWTAYGFDNPAVGPWRSEAALASYALGDGERAIALADAELERARRWQAPGALGHALRVLGLVTGGDAGLALLQESVTVLEGSPARVELARSLAAEGAALLQVGRRAAARDTLSRALDLAERCRAARLVDEVLVDLRRAGYRPRRHLLTGPDSLTSSERRVAELAARGTTNRVIAQLLFVSPKTVELHLTNAYRKLGVDGRHQLGTALAASDPEP